MSREAAEQIVKQEREQKEQMPTYKGLENFKIVEKMGESVTLFIFPCPTHFEPAAPSPTFIMR